VRSFAGSASLHADAEFSEPSFSCPILHFPVPILTSVLRKSIWYGFGVRCGRRTEWIGPRISHGHLVMAITRRPWISYTVHIETLINVMAGNISLAGVEACLNRSLWFCRKWIGSRSHGVSLSSCGWHPILAVGLITAARLVECFSIAALCVFLGFQRLFEIDCWRDTAKQRACFNFQRLTVNCLMAISEVGALQVPA